MTDNVLPMPPRVAVSGVTFFAHFVVRDDGWVGLSIPLEPFARGRRMFVAPNNIVVLSDEHGAQYDYHTITVIPAALLWLANKGPLP